MHIYGPKIFTESKIISNGSILIKNGKISEISESSSNAKTEDGIEFPNHYFLIPGRIDLHIHGLAGVDVMDATPEVLQTMVTQLPKEGTTSFLATTMSMPVDAINKAIKNVVDFMQNDHHQLTGAKILGLHLEGPFIAPSKMGAHEGQYLLAPDVKLMQQWQTLAQGAIKLVTLAPELDGARELIKCLCELTIIPSIGHSNASCQVTLDAIEKGCRHVTHLFNAMSGLHHRTPGVALAALESNVLAEIIADGEHVSWDMLKFVMRVKSKNELCVVTDSMRAKCMPEGEYLLGEQKVHVVNNSARLPDGTLAGSVLTMEQATKNLIEHRICDLNDTIFLSSINPAKQLGIFDELGSIAVGKWADLVVLDENYRVVLTICRGEVAYSSK